VTRHVHRHNQALDLDIGGRGGELYVVAPVADVRVSDRHMIKPPLNRLSCRASSVMVIAGAASVIGA
jgi:hypothetical protein